MPSLFTDTHTELQPKVKHVLFKFHGWYVNREVIGKFYYLMMVLNWSLNVCHIFTCEHLSHIYIIYFLGNTKHGDT